MADERLIIPRQDFDESNQHLLVEGHMALAEGANEAEGSNAGKSHPDSVDEGDGAGLG